MPVPACRSKNIRGLRQKPGQYRAMREAGRSGVRKGPVSSGRTAAQGHEGDWCRLPREIQ